MVNFPFTGVMIKTPAGSGFLLTVQLAHHIAHVLLQQTDSFIHGESSSGQ